MFTTIARLVPGQRITSAMAAGVVVSNIAAYDGIGTHELIVQPDMSLTSERFIVHAADPIEAEEISGQD